MDLNIERADVWAAGVPDEPGGLATMLAELADAGANLEFLIARRSSSQPGKGVVFLTPLEGDRLIAAATELGFKATSSVHSVRVEGLDEPGVVALLTAELAEAGLNLKGVSAATIGARFVMYVGLDSAADAERAVSVLRRSKVAAS